MDHKNLGFMLSASIALAVFGFGFGSQAYACTCAELTVSQQRENATAVFSGTVLRRLRSDEVEKDGVEVTFKVDRIWKGRVEAATSVFTGPTSDLYPFENLCAPQLRVGQKYIVFAFGKNKITTDVCAGTLAFPDAKKVKRQLGNSRRPS